MFRKTAIIGLGLIGGSLAKALRKYDMCETIVGLDLCSETLDCAKKDNCIDEGYNELVQGIRDADLIVISVPVGKMNTVLVDVFKNAKKGAWILDACSVKERICKEAEILLQNRNDVVFIGGHPMAGSEKSGFVHSSSNLFENAPFLLVPNNIFLDDSSDFIQWLKLLKVRPIIMNGEDHDLKVGYISHLPHLISTAIINTISHNTVNPKDIMNLSGGGFKDTTRIAESDPNLWTDIYLNNRRLSQVLDAFIREMESLKELLANNDYQPLYNYLLEAKVFKSKCSIKENERRVNKCLAI
ncbi:prephenate dehydrogenase [Haloplasma contractile]|nr:prephenate dehydrogenase/arogenate dehydrogenase family protein [Haloplasma contractile]